MLGVIVPHMRTRSQSALSPTHQNSGGEKRRLPAAALEAVALGGNSKKEDACQPRPWRAGEGARSCTSLNLHALGPDLLAEVFSHLPFEDRLRSVPLVSKEWRSVSRDPVCWRRVDMEGWFEAKVKDDYWWEFDCEGQVEFLIKKIVDRSCGQLRELRTMHCSDEAIAYIAERCPFLTVLSVRNSPLVTDRSAAKLAASCPEIQELDVSDCYNISNQALDELRRWKPCKLKIKPLVLYFFWQHMLRIYMSSCKSPSQT